MEGERRRQGDQSPKVLMVLFHFPPVGGVSMPRNVYNVRYLPQFGWTPVVLAPRDVGGATDPDALALVAPDTPILRARSLEPRHFRGSVSFVRRVMRVPRRFQEARLTRVGAPGSGVMADVQILPSGKPAPPHAPALLWRLHRLLAFPDSQVGWLPFAIVAAIRAYRVTPFDVVYSTSAPITSHLVAGIVKRLTGVPWVAEFRDPWRGNPVTNAIAGRGPWLHRRMQARLERWIIRSADQIVFVSPSTTRLYRLRYPDAATMVTIPNGHDRSEIVVPSARVERGRYRIVWTGTLDRPDELLVFLQAIDALLTRVPDLAKQLEVDFYGNVSDSCTAIWSRFEARGRLVEAVRFHGFVPRRVALQAVADADAALVMLGSGPGMGQFVPGKLFDYLGQSKQVLAVIPPGDARDILDELNWGVVADPDVTEIGRALERLIALPPPARAADPEGKYDRVALAGRLADSITRAAEDACRERAARGAG
jgi:glycosyltransferase involved in cell wall biosynthesis